MNRIALSILLIAASLSISTPIQAGIWDSFIAKSRAVYHYVTCNAHNQASQKPPIPSYETQNTQLQHPGVSARLSYPFTALFNRFYSWFGRRTVVVAPQTSPLVAALIEQKLTLIEKNSQLEKTKKDTEAKIHKSLHDFHVNFYNNKQLLQDAVEEKMNELNNKLTRTKKVLENQLKAPIDVTPLKESKENTPLAEVICDSLTDSVNSWHEVPLTENAGPPLTTLPQAARDEFDRLTQSIQMDPVFMETQMELGQKHLRNLLRSDKAALEKIPTDSQENYLNAIIALNWSFYKKALEKEQGFEEGTFVIEDKDFKIYNFLLNYVKKFNPTITGTTHDPLSCCSNNPFAYSRDASHFIHVKSKYRPYGIDIRYGQNGLESPLLPANKKHLLFGIVDYDKQQIYIKPENHGLYYADGLPGHINEFVTAQARKSPLAKQVLARFGYELSSDDSENSRKERVPAIFLESFKQALKQDDTFSEQQKLDLTKQAKLEGIKTLCSEPIARSTSPEFQKLVKEYTQEFGSLEHRTGREIILQTDDLLKLTQ